MGIGFLEQIRPALDSAETVAVQAVTVFSAHHASEYDALADVTD